MGKKKTIAWLVAGWALGSGALWYVFEETLKHAFFQFIVEALVAITGITIATVIASIASFAGPLVVAAAGMAIVYFVALHHATTGSPQETLDSRYKYTHYPDGTTDVEQTFEITNFADMTEEMPRFVDKPKINFFGSPGKDPPELVEDRLSTNSFTVHVKSSSSFGIWKWIAHGRLLAKRLPRSRVP
jgi:hypothetical protein